MYAMNTCLGTTGQRCIEKQRPLRTNAGGEGDVMWGFGRKVSCQFSVCTETLSHSWENTRNDTACNTWTLVTAYFPDRCPAQGFIVLFFLAEVDCQSKLFFSSLAAFPSATKGRRCVKCNLKKTCLLQTSLKQNNGEWDGSFLLSHSVFLCVTQRLMVLIFCLHTMHVELVWILSKRANLPGYKDKGKSQNNVKIFQRNSHYQMKHRTLMW